MDKELRILILEDVPTDAKLMERELRKGGIKFSSKRVETREDFINGIKDFVPDLILADYSLPTFDGLSALGIAREQCPNVPFIFVTGSMNEETAVECMKAGAADYVLKDHLVRLSPAVKGALENKRMKEEKVRLEEALWASAREWRATFDAINYPVALMDLEGRISRCNKAMANLLGEPFSEIIGRNCCSLMHGTPGPIEGCPVVRMQESRRRETLVLSIGEQWFNIVADPMADEDGSLIGAVHIMSDITENKRAEEELKRSEEKYRTILESIEEGYFEVDLVGNFTFFNDSLCRMLGYAKDELMGMNNRRYMDKETAKKVYQVLSRLYVTGEPYEAFDWEIIRKDGAKRFHDTSVSLIRNAKGECIGFRGIVRDITERKGAEETLRQSEEKYRMLINNIPDITWTTDSEGYTVFISPYVTKVYGYTPEEIYADHGLWLSRVHPDDIDNVMMAFKSLFIKNEKFDIEYRIQRKDGRWVWLHDRSFSVREKDGKKYADGVFGDITERRRAEEALRSSENKYRTLIENLPPKIFLKDKDSVYISCNKNYASDLKINPDEISERTDYDFYPKDLAEKYRADDKRIIEAGKTEELEEKYIQNGQEVWVNTVKTPVRDEKGNLVGILGIFWDITERKQAQESLRRSEEEARWLARENAAMAEIGRIISSTLNIDEVYESFSKEVKKIIPFDRIVINNIDTEKSTVKNIYMAGEDLRDRNVKDIYSLEGSGNAEMVRTKSSFLLQTEDFTEYKKRFPMLLSTFQAGFRSIMNVPLFSKGKIIGGLLLRSHKPYAYTDENVRLAERVAAQIAGAIANAQLYTERIRAEKEKAALEEQLRQSQKMEGIGRLAGGIAHDFNNLLTIIKGYSQLSLIELKENDPMRGSIEEVKRAADRAADLTRQLLAFSRRQILEMSVLDLNTVLRDLDKMLRRIIGEDIELVTLLAKNLGRVKSDPGQVEQVIMNLAVNARDAMRDGGKLTVETANVELDEAYARSHVAVTPGRYVMLSVSDTGAGMTPEVKERVFEPFFTTKEKGKGTGLGLSTVYGIVKQSDGNIWVYSEAGHGTTFKIYLPRVDEPLGEEKKEAAKGELARGSETILIVEDNDEVRKLAALILSGQGYQVLEASEGVDAIHICAEHDGPIHLLLTDVVMPKMSGRELAESLMPLRLGIKVLYMSGYTDNAIVHHGVLEKGMNYIQKPFTIEGLARKVREVLDK